MMMSKTDTVVGFFVDDALDAIAVRDASARFPFVGEAAWTRTKAEMELPVDPKLVVSVEHEKATYDSDGTISAVAAYVETGLDTRALVRLHVEHVRITVWGNGRGAVGATIRAYLEAWPPRRVEAAADVYGAGSKVPGQYL